jgi:hypothetical protein
VTHLIVKKPAGSSRRPATRNVYRPQFRFLIFGLTVGSDDFVLNPPPRDSVVFQDRKFWLVQLPLEEPGETGLATAK